MDATNCRYHTTGNPVGIIYLVWEITIKKMETLTTALPILWDIVLFVGSTIFYVVFVAIFTLAVLWQLYIWSGGEGE